VRRGLAALAAALALAPAAQADVGAAGLGDMYFPRAGNGGYDALHYDLNLSYDRRANRLAGLARIQARALAPLTRFDLDLKGLRVRRVAVDGARAAFRRAGTELRIKPAAPLAAGQVFTVAVRYRGVPHTITKSPIAFGEPYGFLHTPDGQFVAAEPNGAYTWFPANDHPSDKATFTFRVTVPKGSRAVANGRLVSVARRGKRRTFVWREDAPMATYLATVDTGRWLMRRGRTKGGVPVIVAIDPRIAPHRARRAARFFLHSTARIVDYESSVFGPYPFSSTGAIADDARFHGSRLAFSLETQSRPVYSGLIDRTTIAHELAHQWFGDSVSVARWRDIWLNEGFASFAEYLWLAHTHQLSAHQSFRLDYGVPARSPFWKVVIGDPGRDAMFDIAVYRRGAMTLQALREKIGNGPFLEIIRAWAAAHRHANATTADFIALAEQISGRDLDAFFNTWLYTAGKPTTW
jgi:aminopeptidase N